MSRTKRIRHKDVYFYRKRAREDAHAEALTDRRRKKSRNNKDRLHGDDIAHITGGRADGRSAYAA
ncbi:MAG: hypothetical protein AB1847_16755 [bacterium]